MTDTPWQPIDTMPLRSVGTKIDIREDDRTHTGVKISGIRYERDVIEEQRLVSEHPEPLLGDIDIFVITHTTGTIHTTLDAEWRHHG